MNNITWEEFIKEVSDYTGTDVSEINENTNIFEDLCLDSLGLFGLGSQLTETFNIDVPLSAVAAINSIGDMFKIMKEKGVPADA